MFKLNSFVKIFGASGKLSIRYFLVLSILLPLIVSLMSYVVSAQQADRPWHLVRSVYTGEYGIANPGGLAFSPAADAFLVWSKDGSVSGLGMHEAAVDTRGLRIPAADGRNIAFNGKTNSLFALQTVQLDEFRTDAKGIPASGHRPSRTHSLDGVNVAGARGITFDPASGRMFVLDADGNELVSVAPDTASRFDGRAAVLDGRVVRMSLSDLGAGRLQGIAFNASNGYLYMSDPVHRRLYEVTQAGKKVSEYDLSSLALVNPAALVFAPSVDGTDDPEEMNLFILDSGESTESDSMQAGDGQLVELALGPSAALPPGTTLVPTTLLEMVDISNVVWSPSSPDPAGIDYWPLTNGFVIVDSEVDEMPQYYDDANVFLATTSGNLTGTCDTTEFTPEPTGMAINPDNNHLFIASDSGDLVFEISLGSDGQYCTSDDTVTSTSFASLFGANDTEDVAYGNNTIFAAGGIDAEVWIVPLGPNGILGGGDDGPLTHFDTGALGFGDLEGIGYNADADTIFILSSLGGDRYMGEVTPAGTLLRAYDLGFMGSGSNLRSDVTYAPSSENPTLKSVYIVSRGVDNGANPDENDGKWWEVNIGNQPTNTPDPNATPTRTPTRTRTPTPVVTNTLPPDASTNPMYASFGSGGTVGGLTFGAEDILRFDGKAWSLFFDGSDVGLSATDSFGFSLLDSDRALLTFDAAITLGGVSYTPNDIVRFNATSFGATTTGTFSMYLDGSDVGLDTAAENLDAVSVLPDGRVLISTTGNPSVPGVAGFDEDILAFIPATLGNTTSGTWAMFFDGSDVGLADASGEDTDALDVVEGNIYLSTVGDFSVTGLAGTSNDVFICSPLSLGDVTACTFHPALYFDGSSWLLGSNNLDAFGFLSLGPIATATPTRTPTRTPTQTGTATAIQAAGIQVLIGGAQPANHTVASGQALRVSYPKLNKGPVQIKNTSANSLLGSQAVLYSINGTHISFSEMMGLPANQVGNVYWLPWYNSKTLNTQLRVANVSSQTATVHVRIGGVEVTGSPFTLLAGQSLRKTFPNIDKGPVQIESNRDIVAAERVIYRVNGVDTSFSEMMALPASQLDNVYWLPWYHHGGNTNTQLRFANVSGTTAKVRVFIGGVEVTGSPFTLTAGQSLRRSFAIIKKGPVEIRSTQNIVAAQRLIYKANGVDTSFSEMMALPATQLHTTYWLPWYNNLELNTELRLGVP